MGELDGKVAIVTEPARASDGHTRWRWRPQAPP